MRHLRKRRGKLQQRTAWGPSWGPFGAALGQQGAISGAIGAILEPTMDQVGPTCDSLGQRGAIFVNMNVVDCISKSMWIFLDQHGPIMGQHGIIVAYRRAVRKQFSDHFDPAWNHLGPTWACFGPKRV